jgi:hypothetical protein
VQISDGRRGPVEVIAGALRLRGGLRGEAPSEVPRPVYDRICNHTPPPRKDCTADSEGIVQVDAGPITVADVHTSVVDVKVCILPSSAAGSRIHGGGSPPDPSDQDVAKGRCWCCSDRTSPSHTLDVSSAGRAT